MARHYAFVPLCHQPRSHHSIPKYASLASRYPVFRCETTVANTPQRDQASPAQTDIILRRTRSNFAPTRITGIPRSQRCQSFIATNALNRPRIEKAPCEHTHWTTFVHTDISNCLRRPPTIIRGGGDTSVGGSELRRVESAELSAAVLTPQINTFPNPLLVHPSDAGQFPSSSLIVHQRDFLRFPRRHVAAPRPPLQLPTGSSPGNGRSRRWEILRPA